MQSVSLCGDLEMSWKDSVWLDISVAHLPGDLIETVGLDSYIVYYYILNNYRESIDNFIVPFTIIQYFLQIPERINQLHFFRQFKIKHDYLADLWNDYYSKIPFII